MRIQTSDPRVSRSTYPRVYCGYRDRLVEISNELQTHELIYSAASPARSWHSHPPLGSAACREGDCGVTVRPFTRQGKGTDTDTDTDTVTELGWK